MFWEKRLQLFENLDCFLRCFEWLAEIDQIEIVLDCFCCNWALVFFIDGYSLQSVVGTCCRTLCSENMTLILNIVPINPCSRSGPANNLSSRHISLYFAAALQTRQTLPGLLGFSTGWCGKYHSFPNVTLTSDLPRIFTNPFSTSVSTDCWYSFKFGFCWNLSSSE